MRLTPVPLFYAHNPAKARALLMGRETLSTSAAISAVKIVAAANSALQEQLQSEAFHPVVGKWPAAAELAPEICAVACGSFKQRQPPAIRRTGLLVDSLQAAL